MDLLLNVALCMYVNSKTWKTDAQLCRFLLSNFTDGNKDDGDTDP